MWDMELAWGVTLLPMAFMMHSTISCLPLLMRSSSMDEISISHLDWSGTVFFSAVWNNSQNKSLTVLFGL